VAALGARPKRADPIIILPYLGYGTPKKLTVCGRVLEDEGFRAATDRDGRWRNLIQFWKRLESDEVPGARLRARFLGREVEGVTNREGYFKLQIAPRGRLGPGPWQDVSLELPEMDVKATAHVLVPSARARFGLISDIDDTIVSSNVTRKVRMLLTVALTNARTRKPFPGVAAFYRALHAGVNPVFYVSKSPWNLYAPLIEYLELQRFPRGPLVLRDFGLRMPKNHKARAVEEILATYPKLRFVLSGDDGEDDPDVYGAIALRFPGRILAIYIRSSRTEVRRPVVFAPDAATAAAHAAAEGLIQASELRAVRADAASDKSSSKPALSSGALK
jgi:phosphatidate phosphatase APP1